MVCNLAVVTMAIVHLLHPAAEAKAEKKEKARFNLSEELGFRTSFTQDGTNVETNTTSNPSGLTPVTPPDASSEMASTGQKEQDDKNSALESLDDTPKRATVTFWERLRNINVEEDQEPRGVSISRSTV
jgi:hypothetical protein